MDNSKEREKPVQRAASPEARQEALRLYAEVLIQRSLTPEERRVLAEAKACNARQRSFGHRQAEREARIRQFAALDDEGQLLALDWLERVTERAAKLTTPPKSRDERG